MKVGWIATLGPEADRNAALGRLEVIADTFLSMNTPVQLALPGWLANRSGIQERIRERVRGNLAAAHASGLEVLRVDAGWSAILRLRREAAGETGALKALRETGVVVHPGSFYGMADDGRVVVSLIGPAIDFEEGFKRLSEWDR